MARLRMYRYQDGDSLLHGFDTSLKALSYLAISASLMVLRPPLLAAAGCLLVLGHLKTGIKGASLFRQIRPLLTILILLAISRLGRPGPLLVGWGPLRITLTGLLMGLNEAGRILAVVAAGNLFIGVTRFVDLEAMIARLPLGQASRKAAITARLSLALIPLLLETGLTVKEIIMLRAPGLGRRPFKNLILFARLFLTRSALLARNLERGLNARAYGEGRFYPRPQRRRFRDWLIFFFVISLCAGALWISLST